MPAVIYVVIPTYNERPNLEALVTPLLALREDLRIVVVDDNSPDGTGDLADALAETTGRLVVIHRPRKEGIGPAYIAGFGAVLALSEAAEAASVIVSMDADGSHRAEDLPSLLAALGDADLVLGSRYVPGGATVGWPLSRRVLSRLGGLYARLVLGLPISDLTGGFKAYRREALADLDLTSIRSDGYAFQIETTWRTANHGWRVVEVPIVFTDRVAGRSKLSRRIVLEAVTMVWRLRWERLRR